MEQESKLSSSRLPLVLVDFSCRNWASKIFHGQTVWLWRGGGGLYRLKLHPEILGWNPCWFDIDVDIEGERGESRVRRCLAGAGAGGRYRELTALKEISRRERERGRRTDGRPFHARCKVNGL